MGDSSGSNPGKVFKYKQLIKCAESALEGEGWVVENNSKDKVNVRRLSRKKEGKKEEKKLVYICTSETERMVFTRVKEPENWRSLGAVDAVVSVSIVDKNCSKPVNVHWFDIDEVRDRLNRAYIARKNAGKEILIGRNITLFLYIPEATNPDSHVGAGAGLMFPPFTTRKLPS